MSLQVYDFHDDLWIVDDCQSSRVQNDNCLSSLSADDKVWLTSVDLQKNSLVLNVIDDLYRLISNIADINGQNIRTKQFNDVLISQQITATSVAYKLN